MDSSHPPFLFDRQRPVAPRGRSALPWEISSSLLLATASLLLGSHCAPAPRGGPNAAPVPSDRESAVEVAQANPGGTSTDPLDEASPANPSDAEPAEVAPTHRCSADDWCWYNPRPFGVSLNAVWAGDGEAVWAAGRNGTIWRWDGARFVVTPSGTEHHLMGVWGSGPEAVWVVGEGGTILRWNGHWSPVTSRTDRTLHSVAGTASDDVWAVGEGGTMLHWDGDAWTSVPSATEVDLHGVWAASSDDAWVVGAGGLVLRWNGTTWSRVRSPARRRLSVVWGLGTDDVWAGGSRGTLIHWNGNRWSSRSSGRVSTVTGIWGPSADDIWIAGVSLVHWNGRRLSNAPGTWSSAFASVHGSAETGTWAVGENGVVLRREQDSWRSVSSLTTAEIVAIGGTGPADAWALTALGRTLRWDGEAWTLAPRPIPGRSASSPVRADEYRYRGFTGAWFAGPGEAWAVETQFFVEDVSHLWRWDGTRWGDVSSDVPGLLRSPELGDLWGWGSDHLYVVYHPNVLMRGDRLAWARVARAQIARRSRLDVVGGSGPDDVWAAGADASVHFDGSSWSRVAFPPAGVTSTHSFNPARPRGLWSLGGDDTWMVGDYRDAALHWDGSAWSITNTRHAGPLSDVWSSGPDDVWAVGARGTILHWDGASWARVDSGTSEDLTRIWGSGPADVWVVGGGGSILRHRR